MSHIHVRSGDKVTCGHSVLSTTYKFHVAKTIYQLKSRPDTRIYRTCTTLAYSSRAIFFFWVEAFLGFLDLKISSSSSRVWFLVSGQ